MRKGSVNQLINYFNEEVESVGGKNIECIDTLQIENLSFKYSKNKPYVLRKLNLYCRNGDTI